MRMRCELVKVLHQSAAACAALVLLALPARAGDLTVGGYALESSVRLSRTVFEYTYRAVLSNAGPAVLDATARLAGHGSNLTAVDATLSFGAISAGGSAKSTDTFVVRHDRTRPFDPASLVWNIEAREAPPAAGVFALAPAALALRSREAASVLLQLPVAAGAGGVAASLASTDPVVEVPPTVVVAEGETQAFFSVSSPGPAGTATITAQVPGSSASAQVAVRERLVEVALDQAQPDLSVGEVRSGTVELANPAPAGGRSVALSLSEPGRARLSGSPLVIPAGGTSVSFSVTATASGSETITASVTGVGADSASLRFAIVPAVATQKTSAELIEAARVAGTITEEEAFVYRVFAAFGSPALPAQYQGRPSGQLDDPVVRELPLRFTSLSPTAQAALLPLLYPPAYEGSWGAPPLAVASPLTALRADAANNSRKLKRKKSKRAAQALTVAGVIDPCRPDLPGYTPPLAPGWSFLRTENFKVWYRNAPTSFSSDYYTVDQARQAAVEVAAVIDPIYVKLRGVFGDTLLPDEGLACNGGDGLIDVYVDRLGRSAKAQVEPYPPGACARPGWIWISADVALDPYEARNILAHELVHLWHLVPNRADCSDPRWGILDEASATWAFDFVNDERGDNYEHQFAVPSFLGNGYFADHFSGEWRMRPFAANQPVPAHGNNGYADYPFFEWLSRTLGPQTVRDINAATAHTNPQQSFELGLSGYGGGLRALWPAFALAAWNDHEEDVEDAFFEWEHLAAGSIKHGSVVPANRFIEAELGGQSRREFPDEIEAIMRAPTSGNDIEDLGIGPMTARYLYVRFTDDEVSTVIFRNPLAGYGDRLKVQALLKIDGEWQPVRDWTNEYAVDLCRDEKAERVEEMVIVYSNSHAGNVWFETDPPAVIPFSGDQWPKLDISNSGCFRWKGTTRATVTDPVGFVDTITATVTYERKTGLPWDLLVGRMGYQASGTASLERSGADTAGCTHSIAHTEAPIQEFDSEIVIYLDDILLGEERRADGPRGRTEIEYTETIECPPPDGTQVLTSDVFADWLDFPDEGAPLSEDGKSITGNYTFVDGFDRTIEMQWDLQAEREE